MEKAKGKAGGPPGRVRYQIALILFLLTTINYADRATLSITGNSIQHELGLSPVSMGIVFSAFGWAYVLAQIPGGLLLDRFGSRRVYCWSIALWSLCTLAQAFVGVFEAAGAIVALFLLRFLLGLTEAPSFPANARIVAAWFPAAERGTATAIFNSAQYFAVAVFAPLMGWITHIYGWHHVFVLMGVLGLAGAVLFRARVHAPMESPFLSVAEREHIAAGGALVEMDSAARPTARRGRPDWASIRPLLTSRMLIGIYIGQYAITALTYFFATWFPIYLVQQRGMSIVEAGFSAAVPALSGWVGGILGGIWSDRMLRAGHSLNISRKVPIFCGMALSVSIVGCNFVESEILVVGLMALAFFGKGVAALGWVVIADAAPQERTGLAGGIFNAIGNIAGIVTPIGIGLIVAATGSFDLALVFVALHSLLAIASYAVLVGPIRRLSLPSAVPSSGVAP